MGERTDFQILLADSRKAADLSQKQAADKARVNRRSWGWWESGKTVPYTSNLPAIELALGLKPGTLDEAHAGAVAERDARMLRQRLAALGVLP